MGTSMFVSITCVYIAIIALAIYMWKVMGRRENARWDQAEARVQRFLARQEARKPTSPAGRIDWRREGF